MNYDIGFNVWTILFSIVFAQTSNVKRNADNRTALVVDNVSEIVSVPRESIVPIQDNHALPDPTDPDNLMKLSGRGLMLIRTFMDEVRFNAEGNEVTMIKYCAT